MYPLSQGHTRNQSGIRTSDFILNSSSSQQLNSRESVCSAAPPLNFNTDDSGRRVSHRHRNPVHRFDNTDMIIDDSVVDNPHDCSTPTTVPELDVPTSTLPGRFSSLVASSVFVRVGSLLCCCGYLCS